MAKKNRTLLVILLSLMLCVCALTAFSCEKKCTEHSFGAWTVTKEATCTEVGEELRACEVCGNVEKRETAALGHTYEAWVDEVDATCTVDGVKGHKDCSVCSKHFDAEGNEIANLTISAKGHSFTNYVSNNDATCESDGTKTAYCDHGCGETDTITDEGTAKGHTYGEWVSNGDGTHTKTCANDSTHTVTENCHGGEATCTTKATCEDCNAKYGEPKGHSYTNYESNNDATCTEDGTKTAYCDHGCGETDTITDEGTAKGHTYGEWVSNGDGTHTKTCANDSTHTVTENCHGGEATCTTKATCEDCNAKYGEPKGHSYTNYESNNDATCTEDGTKTAQCDNGCGQTNTITDEGSALGHTWSTQEIIAKVDADCESDGTKAYWHCNACDKDFDEDKETELTDLTISALGHNSDGTVDHKDAKCTETGVVGGTYCTRCNAGKAAAEATIPALGHTWSTQEIIAKVDADCESDGTKAHWHCNACNKDFDEDKETELTDLTIKSGHDFGEWQSIGDGDHVRYCKRNNSHKETKSCHGGEATCTEQAICDDCGGKYGEPKGHSYTNYVSNDDATCTEDGTKTAQCDNGCGETDTITDEGTAKGHSYSEEWSHNETHHWHGTTCGCDEKQDYDKHTVDDSGWCTICDASVTSTSGVTYQISSDETYAEVSGYNGSSAKVRIADSYNGLPVTGIRSNAFTGCGSNPSTGCTTITSVIIPSSVTSIDSGAFWACDGLTSVTIPSSVTSIGSSAFADCALTEVIIPYGVTSIGENAFARCYSLTKAIIPDSVTTIGESVFSGCRSLKEITIPFVGAKLGVTSSDNDQYPLGYIFGKTEYEGCVKTTQYYNPGSSPTKSAYYIPESLKKVTVTGGNVLYGAFYNCSNLTSVTLGKNVTGIESYAFYGCGALEELAVPFAGIRAEKTAQYDWNKYLLGNMFGNTSYTGSVSITQKYSSNGSVYSTKFEVPSSLKKVTVSGGIIAYGALYGFSTLTSLSIGEDVTSIGNYAFYGCSALTEINYNAIQCAELSAQNNAFVVSSSFKVTVGASVKKIPSYLFNPCNKSYSAGISELEFVGESACETIGSYAFAYCDGLSEVTFGNSLKSIGDYAFYNCGSLTSITIPDSVTSIGEKAFYYCYSLTSVSVGNGVTSIGSEAFEDCSSLTSIQVDENNANYSSVDGILYNKEKTTFIHIPKALSGSITIPDSVTSIGSGAFKGCSSLTSVSIGNGVTSIGSGAFEKCTSLTSVNIGNGVTSIGDSAFYYCTSLTSVTIGNGVTSIGSGAFEECSSLTSVSIGNGVTSIGNSAFKGCDNLAYNEYDNAFYLGNSDNPYMWLIKAKSTSITSCTIHEKTKFIHNSAFSRCSSLTSIIIPDSVTSIGDDAFSNCSKLTSITIPDSVTSIGSGAFASCSSLTNITIPNSVTSIGASAFASCYSLTSITIPDSVTSIGDSAFWYCTSLTSVTIGNSVTSIGDSAFNGCSSLTSITIPDSVTSIGDSAFNGCSSLTSITIPDSVTSIGDSAFSGCSSLKEITIPFVGAKAGVTSTDMYQYPFGYIFGTSYYTGGTSTKQYYYGNSTSSTTYSTYYIPSSLTTVTVTGGYIPYGAFYNCSSLTSVSIGNNVTSIGEDAFFNCSKLKAVYISDIAAWCNISFENVYSNPLWCAHNLYLNNELVTRLVIPDTVTKINAYAFYNCSTLTSVSIGNGITSIGESAFDDCDSLTYNEYDNAYYLGNDDNPYMWLIKAKSKDITSCTIHEKTKFIHDSAFSWCSSLSEVTIPDSVISIGDGAFSNCSSLSCNEYDNAFYLGNSDNPYVVLVKAKSTSITSCTIHEKTKFIHDSAFSGCSGLTSITIPDSVTSIGRSAFRGCSSLTSVTIPDSVTSIGDSAFYKCSSLTSITIPSSVTSIGRSAFRGCSSLTSITIPSSVTSIGSYAFYECSSLTSVTIGNGVTSIGSSAFDGCSNLTSVYYKGSESEWNEIVIYSSNGYLTSATRYYYSEGNPFEGESAVEEGNYWHYDTDGKTIVVWAKE